MAGRKILHVVGALDIGGIERWLVQVVRAAPKNWQIDFLVRHSLGGCHEGELRELGCRILPGLDNRNPIRFSRLFTRAFRLAGPYDVVHSHVGPFNGIVMLVAAWHRVPVRISHAHVDNRLRERNRNWLRQRYLTLSRWLLARYSTHRLAVSSQAAQYLFCQSVDLVGPGIDFAPFRMQRDRAVVRRSIGMAEDAIVLGFLGRLEEEKAPGALLPLAQHAHNLDARVRLLLVGDGPLRNELQASAAGRGIAPIVHFHGAAREHDVPGLLGAMDVLIVPSLSEGLGLALVEAQAAGLPSLVSEAVPEEAIIVPALVHRIQRGEPVENWARTALDVVFRQRPPDALELLQRSRFDLGCSVRALERFYMSNR